MQQPGSITFGTPLAPATAATGTFGGFGSATPQQSTFGATNTGLKFGATPTSTPSLFGGGLSTPATGGLNFGAPTSTATSTGFSFGSNAPPQSATTTTAGTGFSFGATTAPTSAPNTGLSFGGFNKPATSAAQPLSFGLGGATATPASTAPGTSLFGGAAPSGGGLFGAKPTITTPAGVTPVNPITNQQQSVPNVGLGGVDTFQNKPGTSGATTKEADGKLSKEQQLPNEFLQLIDGFKNHIKKQKMFSSDVARGTIKPLRKIQEDIDQLKTMLVELGNNIETSNRQQAEKVKYETAKCLAHAEMAQRIHDTPPGFQVDNTAPLQYFIETVHKFENDLSAIRQQIEATEKHIKSLERPKTLSSQEMTLGLRRLHETFVALAGRLQSLHSQVEMQKTQYLNMRKYLFKDTSNVLFDQNLSHQQNQLKALMTASATRGAAMFTPPKRAAGPTPFSTLGKNTLSFISSSQQQQSNPSSNNGVGGGPGHQTTVGGAAPPPAYPTGAATPSLNWGTSGGGIKTTQPPSYNASVGLQAAAATTSAAPSNDFQLQKPPTGNKREDEEDDG